MEYLEEAVPITDAPLLSAHRDRWTDEIRALVEGFHRQNLVHGDLRDVNILCKEGSVMLIDFDWRGMEREVCYPTSNLNEELLQERTQEDLKIRKEDDRPILRNLVKGGLRVQMNERE